MGAAVAKRSDVPLLDVLRAIKVMHDEVPDFVYSDACIAWVMTHPRPAIIERFPQFPPKVVLARLQQLADQRLIEYGTSINWPWLTPQGKQRLAELEHEIGGL